MCVSVLFVAAGAAIFSDAPPGPGPTSIADVQMQELAVGAVQPTGWLKTQLQIQVHTPQLAPCMAAGLSSVA